MIRTRFVGIFAAVLLFAALVVPVAPAAAGGYTTLGIYADDPELPVVVALYLRDGFTAQDASDISTLLTEDLGGLVGLPDPSSGTYVFSRADLVSLGLGDADYTDGILRSLGLMYVSITGYVISDDIIGDAIRFDVRAPSLTEAVLASVIVPAALVTNPLAFLQSLDLDLSGLPF